MARFMISTDVTEWKVLVAATITMTRMLPTQKHTQRHGGQTCWILDHAAIFSTCNPAIETKILSQQAILKKKHLYFEV